MKPRAARSPAAALVEWFARGHRDLPWRRTRDPYRIWLSEIMLQQTRAAAVVPYYERFLARFPDVGALARAAEEEVLALWAGLGYYSRARNVHRAARLIAAAGSFPRAYEDIRALPGAGDYTAAAVASIAFGLPHAVLDGNVMRVIARLTDDASDIRAARTRARFAGIAGDLLDRKRPGVFNQALMELGATVCLPREPHCGSCPLSGGCLAFARGTAGQLPVKLGGRAAERIESTLALASRNGRVLLWQRPAGSRRMAGFWELPAVEQLPGGRRGRILGEFRHSITHHHYRFTVQEVAAFRTPPGFCWFSAGELCEIPLSTITRKALRIAAVR